MPARLLIFATSNWLGSPRFAAGFKRAGFEVAVVAPSGNHLLQTRFADSRFELKTGMSLHDIRALLVQLAQQGQVDSVVPADDGAIVLLYHFAAELLALEHAAAAPEAALAEVLRSALPPPAYFKILRSKYETHRMAQAAGIATPAQAVAVTLEEALAFAASEGYPLVLKPEQGAAGEGIAVCANEAALRQAHAARAVQQPAQRLLVESHVGGPEVSYLFVAQEGRVLLGLSRQKLQSYPGPFSPSSVVQVIDLPAAAEAARLLVASCAYTGFGSVQFLLDAEGEPQFIEFNTRPIPMMHLGEAAVGIDWCAAWFAATQGQPLPVFEGARVGQNIALFPQEMQRDPHSPYLGAGAIHDVPWDDPDLLRSYLAPPFETTPA